MEETLNSDDFNIFFETIEHLAVFTYEERCDHEDVLRQIQALASQCETSSSPNRNETNNKSTTEKIKRILKIVVKCIKLLSKLHEVIPGVPCISQAIFNIIIFLLLKYFFNEDIVSNVADEFRYILDENFMMRCRATSSKFRNCLRYIRGLPPLNTVESNQRETYTNRLASDLPINTGVKGIAELAEDIRKNVEVANELCKKTIKEKVQLYCLLVTFRELFLYLRCVVAVTFNPDDKSILEVITGQRRDDEILLRFLYKPNIDTVDAYLFCDIDAFSSKSPFLGQFLQTRQLTRNLDNLDGKRFKIYSAHYPENLLSVYDFKILSCVRCHYDTKGSHTNFTFRHVQGDVYTIHPCSHPENSVYTRDWVRMASDPKKELSEWCIIKIEPKTSDGEPSYLIGLKSSNCSFMFTDSTGRVYTWGRQKGETKCLWRLQRIEERKD